MLEWVNASNGEIPRAAEKMGSSFGEGIFLARAEHDEGIYPGTFLPDEGVVDIPVGGQVISKSNYQVISKTLLFVIQNETIFRWR